MKNKKKKATKAKAAVKRPKATAKVATGVRAKAARRTAEGKFTKVIFNQIGGKECRRFAAMTWKERDAFMAKPENAAVQERYEKHLASRYGVKPLFTLGQVVATPGALAALEKAGQQPGDFLARHVSGDWGEVPPEDIKENEFSLKHGFRLLSAYRTSAGDKLWVITEADRSSTCILLPEEY